MDSEDFINEVAKYDCLFKIKSDDYKNREKKDIAWNKIAFRMKTDGKSKYVRRPSAWTHFFVG